MCRFFLFLAELVVDKAMELRFVGGVYGGNIKPTPFLCLTLKMLQIQPEKDIIVEFIKNEDFKWVKLLTNKKFSGSELGICWDMWLQPVSTFFISTLSFFSLSTQACVLSVLVC